MWLSYLTKIPRKHIVMNGVTIQANGRGYVHTDFAKQLHLIDI